MHIYSAYTHSCALMYICTFMYTAYTCTHACIHTFIHIYRTYTHSCAYICIPAQTCTLHTHIYTFTLHTHALVHTCTPTYTHVCIHIHAHTRLLHTVTHIDSYTGCALIHTLSTDCLCLAMRVYSFIMYGPEN